MVGHDRLNPKTLADMDEPAITGMLCDSMEAFLDSPARPDWSIHFTTVDDQPESVDGKTGKRRPRTDICIRSTDNRALARPASRFRFEAKRLSQTYPVAEYLGEKGMLALITGYYGNLPFTGMIGYVQSETCATWADRIKAAITKNPKTYHATTPPQFPLLHKDIPNSPFLSSHNHKGPKSISHTLLLCK